MSLQVFTGPMYSEKTKNMISVVSKLSDITDSKVLIINHQLDTRNGSQISSHSSLYKGLSDKMDTISTSTLSSVDVSNYTVIGLDETNFFDDEADLVNTIKLWISQDKHIICAGLDGDSNMNPFGYISKLLPIADHFVKLNAICTICTQDIINKGEKVTPTNVTPAPFTKKIIEGNDLIDVGGKDKYIAVCRKHH